MKQRSVGRLGIDLGDQTSHPCVLDEQAEVILEGTVPTTEAVSVSNSRVWLAPGMFSRQELILPG